MQPGTYYENINYNGKNITVASLFLTTADTTYISQTIIDGNENGSVVTFDSGENSAAVLTGFTITNGYTDHGCGVRCLNSSPKLENLTITGNYSYAGWTGNGNGGGIYCYESSPSLVNVTISGNAVYSGFTGAGTGGGIYCYESNPSLVNVTITVNDAGASGGGIFCNNSNLDLMNVIISDNSAEDGGGVYCCHSSPSLVDVTISGNSASYGGGIYCDSLSSPSLAIVTIAGNSGAVHGGGIYCDNSDPDLLCVSIADNEAESGAGIFTANNSNFSFELVSITDNSAILSGGGIYCAQSDARVIQNIIVSSNEACLGGGFFLSNTVAAALIDVQIVENIAENGGGIYLADCSAIDLDNIQLLNNTATSNTGGGGGVYCSNSDFSVGNSLLENNHAFYDGGGIYLDCYWTELAIENTELTGNVSENKGGGIFLNVGTSLDAINSAFNYNYASDHGGGLYSSISNVSLRGSQFLGNTGYYGGGISNFASIIEIINTTLCNNNNTGADEYGASICCLGNGSNLNIKNSISWNNLPFEINLTNSILTTSYSNIQGGESEIAITGNGVVMWLDGNIDEDPLFVGTGEHPNSLLEDSPCIDTCDPDTLGLNLPPWDIIGNVRIWDGDGDGIAIIDMGAYEYGAPPYVEIDEDFIVQTPESHLYQNYPNPFNPYTTISYLLAEVSSNTIKIYNIKGQIIKTFVNDVKSAGEHSVIWDGTDDNNKPVSSGIYFYKLKINDYEKTKKMILLK
ncbi:MAG: T9SS type A sorting domain-containing protein [Candidatus Cloacimonetes bacterium]|nr:T9SS type A sorting domain-containing protein [Candidatus Cloacimonadota bacterium]